MDNILARILLEGGDLVKKQLEDIGKSGEKSLAALDAAGKKGAAGIATADKAITRASVSFVTAQTNIGKLGSNLGNLGSSFLALGSNLATAAVAIAGVAAVLAPVAIGLFALAKSAADTTDAVRDAAIAAGTTADNFSALGFAAEQSGAHAENLTRALSVISDETAKAIDAGARSSGAFAKMGIALVDASGRARDTGEVFKDVAAKISAIDNPANKTAATIDLFGRRVGPALVQTLNEGRAGLAAFAADAKKLGIVFTAADLAIGDRFNDAVDRVKSSLTGLKTAMGLAFAGPFIDSVNSFADAIAASIPFMKELAESAAKQLAVAFQVIGQIVSTVLIPAFKAVNVALQALADAINFIFGTSFSVADIVAFVAILVTLTVAIAAVVAIAGGFMTAMFAIGSLIGTIIAPFLAFFSVVSQVAVVLFEVAAAVGSAIAALNPIVLAILAVIAAITLLIFWLTTLDWTPLVSGAIQAWNAVVKLAQDAGALVVAGWNATIAAIVAVWNTLVGAAQTLWASIKGVWDAGVAALVGAWESVKSSATEAWNSIVATIKNAFSDIVSGIQTVINWLNTAWEIAQKAWEAILRVQGSSPGGNEGGSGRAQGGRMYGPGTGTSDSIPAWLSSGEWVIKAAAVKKYGHALFAALNGMQLPASALKKLLGHAGGGPVDFDLGGAFRGLAPLRLAEGGAVSSQPTVRLDLVLAGEAFEGLMAPRQVADKLIRFALNDQVKSGGRKPNWYRG